MGVENPQLVPEEAAHLLGIGRTRIYLPASRMACVGRVMTR